jgi:chemotaxis protein CheZ
MSQQQDLQQRLNQLEQSDGMVPVAEIRDLLKAVRDLFEGKMEDQISLSGELSDLAAYINTAKSELKSFANSNLAEGEIPDASDQLDAVVQATEQATHRIMDSCEAVEHQHQALRGRLLDLEQPLDPDIMASVDDLLNDANTHLTNIFEACNFQDLTGQRIQKIVGTLRNIEQQVLRMVILFGLKQRGEATDSANVESKLAEAKSSKLENGPQLPGEGLEQDDVDELLAKLL